MRKKGVVKLDQQEVVRIPQITSIDKLRADVKFRWHRVKLRNTIDEVIMKMSDEEKTSLMLMSTENDKALLSTSGCGSEASNSLDQAIAIQISNKEDTCEKLRTYIVDLKQTYDKEISDMGQKYEELVAEKVAMQKLERTSDDIIRMLTVGLNKKTEQNNRVLTNLYRALNVN